MQVATAGNDVVLCYANQALSQRVFSKSLSSAVRSQDRTQGTEKSQFANFAG